MELEFNLLTNGECDEHNGVGFLMISETFAMHNIFFPVE